MTLVGGIKPERLLHASLAGAAERVMQATRKTFSQDGKIDGFVIAWPSDAVKTDQGETLDGPFIGSLKGLAEDKRPIAVRALAERTQAYALLIVEQQGDKRVEGRFESPHGAERWEVTLERHGDCWIAGPLVKQPGVVRLFRKD